MDVGSGEGGGGGTHPLSGGKSAGEVPQTFYYFCVFLS